MRSLRNSQLLAWLVFIVLAALWWVLGHNVLLLVLIVYTALFAPEMRG